jgi:pyrroline-5-carboxylate reductase
MAVTLPSIAVLGAGAMGGAVLSGLLKPGVLVDGSITVTTSTEASAAALRSSKVTALSTEMDAAANRRAVIGARIVVVAVKPLKVAGLLSDIADSLDNGAIVVSVAVGVTTATMEALVACTVLRAMPNTPASIGRGVTGVAAGSRATQAEVDVVAALFGTVGTVLVVPEDQIDALSTISGSGPAYVFYLVEQLTATAVNLGFTAAEAATMVQETFLGASELLAASDLTPTELRRQVTSPNGTTERAVAVLQAADLAALFDRATAAALARAKELAAGGSQLPS